MILGPFSIQFGQMRQKGIKQRTAVRCLMLFYNKKRYGKGRIGSRREIAVNRMPPYTQALSAKASIQNAFQEKSLK